jgi:hypothetical protein
MIRLVFITLIIAMIGGLAVVLVLFGQAGGMFDFVSNPTYNINATVVLERIQRLSVLTTTRYNFSSLVISQREMPDILAGLYGESLVLVAVGHVTAGVDLAQLTEDDISLENGVLTLRLPPPTLQDCFLNEGSSYVVSRDTGIFNRAAPNLDTEARRFAVRRFVEDAADQNILDTAREQAQITIAEFLNLVQLEGIESVSVISQPPDPDSPLPDSCN